MSLAVQGGLHQAMISNFYVSLKLIIKQQNNSCINLLGNISSLCLRPEFMYKADKSVLEGAISAGYTCERGEYNV